LYKIKRTNFINTNNYENEKNFKVTASSFLLLMGGCVNGAENQMVGGAEMYPTQNIV